MKIPQGTLFVIDDDRNSRKAVAALASSLKIKCETFASAEEFLEHYDSLMLGCALVDVHLPGIDGLQLLERLRAADSLLSVVVVSAYADVSMAVRAMKRGAVSVLEKPYRADDLIATVLEALDLSARLEQPLAQHSDSGRQRLLAHDLHDGVAQYLVMAIMFMEDCERRHDMREEKAQVAFHEAMRLLRQSLKEVRGFISGTHVATAAASLGDALQGVVAEFRDRLDVELVHEPQLVQPGSQVIGAVYRMVQESLTNAWRHSGSRRAHVEVKQYDGDLCVDVKDWGIGFDVDKVDRSRFGLRGIRERTRLLGGEVAVTSSPGEGARVSIRIPCSPPASRALAVAALAKSLVSP
jgi:signal transduction histidine kinase